MSNNQSPKIVCKYCSNDIEPGKLRCKYCGRDRIIGLKQWEYVFGGLVILSISLILTFSLNAGIKIVKTIFVPQITKVVRISSSTPTALQPSRQKFVTFTPLFTQPTNDFSSTDVPVLESTTCPGVTVMVENTSKGDILHIHRCSDGWKYDTPPLAKGANAMSPNNDFLVYCSYDGYLFGIKIGKSEMKSLENLRPAMPIFRKQNIDISINFSFYTYNNQTFVTVMEIYSGQSEKVNISKIFPN